MDDTLLRNISFETSGQSYQAVTANTMFDVFGMTLVAILMAPVYHRFLHRFHLQMGDEDRHRHPRPPREGGMTP